MFWDRSSAALGVVHIKTCYNHRLSPTCPGENSARFGCCMLFCHLRGRHPTEAVPTVCNAVAKGKTNAFKHHENLQRQTGRSDA